MLQLCVEGLFGTIVQYGTVSNGGGYWVTTRCQAGHQSNMLSHLTLGQLVEELDKYLTEAQLHDAMTDLMAGRLIEAVPV